MISQPVSNFKNQFSQKEEVCSYDNIALNQRLGEQFSKFCSFWMLKAFPFESNWSQYMFVAGFIHRIVWMSQEAMYGTENLEKN